MNRAIILAIIITLATAIPLIAATAPYDYVVTFVAQARDAHVTPVRVDVARHGTAIPRNGLVRIMLARQGTVLDSKNVTLDFASDRIGIFNGTLRELRTPVDNVTFALRFPYDTTADELIITDDTGTSHYELSALVCNRNRTCDLRENSVTCPDDCPGDRSGLCQTRDGYCDKTCPKDPDCVWTTPVTQPSGTPSNATTAPNTTAAPGQRDAWTSWRLGLGALLLILILLLIIYKRRKRGAQAQQDTAAPPAESAAPPFPPQAAPSVRAPL